MHTYSSTGSKQFILTSAQHMHHVRWWYRTFLNCVIEGKYFEDQDQWNWQEFFDLYTHK